MNMNVDAPAGSAGLAIAGTVVRIPIAELHDSPWNPRKTYLDIQDLADDIKAVGDVLQPLLVRPRRPNPLRDDITDGFEIVFGHRRKRAAAAALRLDVPCMVRELTAAEARRMQISENLQRKDVHPFEEAEGFEQLMELDGLSGVELAKQIGKSKQYVSARLRLLDACGLVRNACIKGEIGAEVALLIARLGSETLQRKALARIEGKNWKLSDGGKKSFRAIRDLLAEEFTLGLDKALFDPEDGALIASVGRCSACPKLVANAPEYADLLEADPDRVRFGFGRAAASPNTCTDPDCFANKKDVHLRNEAARVAKENGVTVVGGNSARQALSADGHVKGAFVSVDTVKAALKKVKGSAPKPVMLQDQRTGKLVKAFKRADLQQVGVAIEAKATQQDLYQQRAEEEKAQRASNAEMTRKNIALLKAVRLAMAGTPRTEADLRAAARVALRGVDYRQQPVIAELWGADGHSNVLKNRIDSMSVAEVTQLLMDCALVDQVVVSPYSSEGPVQLLAAAARLGVDLATAGEPSSPGGEGAAKEDEESPAPAAQEEVKDDAGCAGGQFAHDLVDAMRTPVGEEEKVSDEAGAGAGCQPAIDSVDESAPAGVGEEVKDEAGGAAAGGQPADVSTMAMRAMLSKVGKEPVPRAELDRQALAVALNDGLVDTFTRITGDHRQEVNTTMVELTPQGQAWLARFEVQA